MVRWRPASEGGFDARRYTVVEVPERHARAFSRRHHYSASWPSIRLSYGLFEGHQMVGVIALGVPMSVAVLARPFPGLEPYTESLELSRLVLLDRVPSNGESFACARAFELAARRGVRSLVMFSDPVPRVQPDGTVIKRGHVGTVYQALGCSYLGRATPRSLVLLPGGTVLTARALAKVTGHERGRDGVIARLTALGATAPGPRQDPREWLREALEEVRATRLRHPGNHRYALRIGTRAQRTRVSIAMAPTRYPKKRIVEKEEPEAR